MNDGPTRSQVSTPRSHVNAEAPRVGGMSPSTRVPAPLRVALYRGRSLISRLIQWQTRSPYSHAALLLGSGEVIEAWHVGGVARNVCLLAAHKPDTRVDIFRVDALSPADAAVSIAFAHDQIGKGYDFLSIARFLSRSQSHRKETGRWYCSELVFASLQQGCVKLLERVEPCDVSPGMLALSPRLILDEQIGGDAR